jgi:hypothetical protein
MYVREKRMRRGEKVYPYYQLVRSTWRDGKSRQTVVAHIPRQPFKNYLPIGSREDADIAARMLGLLCGVVGCGSAPTEEAETVGVGFGKEEGTSLLCANHSAELKEGETLTLVTQA